MQKLLDELCTLLKTYDANGRSYAEDVRINELKDELQKEGHPVDVKWDGRSPFGGYAIRPMVPNALQVICDGDGNWRWVLLAPTDDPLVFEEHSAAECDFSTYDAAAHAGLVALGQADGQLVEDERADPVGDGC